MALTEVVRLRLEATGFKKLFDDNKKDWEKLAERARAVIASEVSGHEPAVDEIRKVALPLVELNPHLRKFIADGKPVASGEPVRGQFVRNGTAAQTGSVSTTSGKASLSITPAAGPAGTAPAAKPAHSAHFG